ncbi:MAG: hypothetical protein AAF772_10425 [Acidobacteriota bacterium]
MAFALPGIGNFPPIPSPHTLPEPPIETPRGHAGRFDGRPAREGQRSEAPHVRDAMHVALPATDGGEMTTAHAAAVNRKVG